MDINVIDLQIDLLPVRSSITNGKHFLRDRYVGFSVLLAHHDRYGK